MAKSSTQASRLDIAEVDLEALTPKQLNELAQRAQAQLEQNKATRLAALREKIERMCEDEGFKPTQVIMAGRFGKVEPKFRDPKTGKTWANRGVKPKWLIGREEECRIS